MAAKHNSERRTETMTLDLLQIRSWKPERYPKGDVLTQNEYKAHPLFANMFQGASKSSKNGYGYPEYLCMRRGSEAPAIVVECKSNVEQLDQAAYEASEIYGAACAKLGHAVLAVGVAGQEKTQHKVRVLKRVSGEWVPICYEGNPIGWFPTPAETELLLSDPQLVELAPVVPEPAILAQKAEEINRILRESGVRDDSRPTYVGAFILALWKSQGNLRRETGFILSDINQSCTKAFETAAKSGLRGQLHIDESNTLLAQKAWSILNILEKLNVVSADFSHDYLGQLYEAFFRYMGGNTIGQYFTPRHITRFMADICRVTQDDVVIDPACGTGGFLIGALMRAKDESGLSYKDTVEMVKKNLIGYEVEPATAALCVANMILRGDGQSGISQADAFKAEDFPTGKCSVALMNPPFPHKKTDVPPEKFIERALEALRDRGKLAVIIPTSFIAKRGENGKWRARILETNTLLGVIELPDELFQPYAATTTSIILIEKGVRHDPTCLTTFVRVKHDGFELKKRTRVPRPDQDELEIADSAIKNKTVIPGFSGVASVAGEIEWAAGAYIPASEPDREELEASIDELIRRHASFYIRYSREIARQRAAIAEGLIEKYPYRDQLSDLRKKNASNLPARQGTIGGMFDIFYGQKELHSRDGIPNGDTLIISPTEEYNGCYGWLDFPAVLEPPFATVAQTGSIGEAFVQTEPCAVNDDCLVLLPKLNASTADIVIAAATIRLERWRFNYGRKLTPARIAEFPYPEFPGLEATVANKLADWKNITEQSVSIYAGTEPTNDPTDDLVPFAEPV